ncbi:hypothetical protein lerEdw1_005761 [Lerista edwardsae]|nr:hypothetical protein lerEdw1_005761 [Lerista edwardsae]
MTFLAMGSVCTITLMYILCTDCWMIAAAYLAWLVFDWNTPQKGGRRSSWVRSWAVWRYYRDYFPVRLVKTHNLLTSRNYIFGYHPHGILGMGAFCNFSTEATGVSQKFPGIRTYLATLAGNFRFPILRDYLMFGGICPVTRDSIDYLLSKNGTGNAIVIVVGGRCGIPELHPRQKFRDLEEPERLCQAGFATWKRPFKKGLILLCWSPSLVVLRGDQHEVYLGIVQGKHCLTGTWIVSPSRADLVPVYSFGENEAYKQVILEEGSWGRWLQKKFQKYIGFAPCLFHGRGLFSGNTWGLLPYSTPITTVVGEPITIPKIENPSLKQVDFYHSLYMSSLIKLFDKYKAKFGLPETAVLEVN